MGQHQRGMPAAPARSALAPYLRSPIIVTVSLGRDSRPYSTVESNARRVLFDSACQHDSSHLAHRVEDPLGVLTGAQPLTPQRQHARVEALMRRSPNPPPPSSAHHSAAARLPRGPSSPPTPAAPSPPRSPTPAPTAGPDPRTDPRTTRHRTTSAGDRPRTDAPTRRAPEPRAAPTWSNSSRSGFSVPCIPPILPHPPTRSCVAADFVSLIVGGFSHEWEGSRPSIEESC